MSLETVPKDLRGLRACLVCSLIKVFIRQIKLHRILNFEKHCSTTVRLKGLNFA